MIDRIKFAGLSPKPRHHSRQHSLQKFLWRPVSASASPTLSRLLFAGMMLLVLLLSFSPLATAQATNRVVDLQSLIQTDLRALALGNAYGPIARGEGALLYNPAGLAQYKFDIKLDGALAVEGEAGGFLNDTRKLLDSATSTDITNYLTKYLGTTQNYRAQTFVNLVANLGRLGMGFGAGVLDQKRYQFEFQDTNLDGAADSADTYIQTNRDLKMSIAGIAFEMLDGQMLMGFNYKNFTYTEKIGSVTFGTLASSSSIETTTIDTAYKGSGVDIGLIWRMETLSRMRGQYSFTAFNVGGISLAPDLVGAETLDVPATYNFGISIAPEFPLLHVVASAEMEDLTDAIKVREGIQDYGRSRKQRLHFGLEVGMFGTATGNNILNARVGVHRGFASYGVELNLFSGLRLLYTKYQDNWGRLGRQDLHDFQAIQLSLGIAL